MDRRHIYTYTKMLLAYDGSQWGSSRHTRRRKDHVWSPPPFRSVPCPLAFRAGRAASDTPRVPVVEAGRLARASTYLLTKLSHRPGDASLLLAHVRSRRTDNLVAERQKGRKGKGGRSEFGKNAGTSSRRRNIIDREQMPWVLAAVQLQRE